MGKGNYWPVKNRIYWCPQKNVPLLKDRCNNNRAPQLKLTEPGDARPAFEYDVETIREAFQNEFGTLKGFNEFLGKGVVLLNKVPFMDEMKEIISQGAVIGRVYYEPFTGRWRLRLSRPGILRILDQNIVSTIVVKGGLKTLKRRRKLKAGNENFRKGEQIVILDDEGEPIGIGYFSNDEIHVHNVFFTYYPSKFAEDIESNWEDVIVENEKYLNEMEEKAVEFIRTMYRKHGGPVIVSFSSGKDSLVALHLTLQAGLKPVILFNNTGIELPETIEHVYRIADMFGLEVIESSAGNAFWESVEKIGPPGKDYRWCCKITKLAPLAETINKQFPKGALNIVGQRAFESLDRAKSGRVWRNKWLPQLLNISPIQYWSQLAVYLYIFKHKLPLNPLYYRGFDRLGCFMCPAATVAEYQQVKKTHPELWSKWESILYRWASKLGLTEEEARIWVEKGVWRWLTPAVQKKRLEKRLKLDMPEWTDYYRRWLDGFPLVKDKSWGVSIEFNNEVEPGFLSDQYSVIGPFEKVTDTLYRLKKGEIEVETTGNRVEIRGLKGRAGRELAYDIIKLYYRWTYCGKCRLCEASCPTGSIKVVNGKPVVESSTCIHCKLCIDNCPVSDVTVERIIVSVNEGEVTAWRRKWKRSRESIIKRFQQLKLKKSDTNVEEEHVEEEGFFLGG
jgi:phosphoadenosine phosphosulfate reductase